LTIWWTKGYHCLTCRAFTLNGCKEHRAGNIPGKAIIEATLEDVRILSDDLAGLIVAELKGDRDNNSKDASIPVPPDIPGGPPLDNDEGAEESGGDETLAESEHFLASRNRNEFICSCGRKFGSEHVFSSHVEFESQLSSVGDQRSRNSLED